MSVVFSSGTCVHGDLAAVDKRGLPRRFACRALAVLINSVLLKVLAAERVFLVTWLLSIKGGLPRRFACRALAVLIHSVLLKVLAAERVFV